MNGNLRRTRRIGMKGEKRVAAAMLVARIREFRRALWSLGKSEGSFSPSSEFLKGREGGARVEIVFFDLAVSVKGAFRGV
jgi:hypothetical protein